MIPYKIKITNPADNAVLSFESNEKPVKGDIFTLKDNQGKPSMIKIVEVAKVLNQISGKTELEYECIAETHQENAMQIGFGKRL